MRLVNSSVVNMLLLLTSLFVAHIPNLYDQVSLHVCMHPRDLSMWFKLVLYDVMPALRLWSSIVHFWLVKRATMGTFVASGVMTYSLSSLR